MVLENLIGRGLEQVPTDPGEIERLLSRFSRLRADALYDGSFSPSGAEVESLIEEVELLQAQLQSWLKDHPLT